MKNFGTVIDNFDAVTKQYVDNKVPTDEHIKGIKVDNATLADTAKKVQNAFTYKAHNKAKGTTVPIAYDGSEAARLDFSADDFAYDYNSVNDITVKLVDKGYATTSQVNAKYTKPESGIPKSDLAEDVKTSLGKADTALQSDALSVYAKKSDLAQVATSGNYNDLSNKPTIPTDYVKYTVQTLTDAQKSQARSNIGAGTSNFDGTWGSLSGKPNVVQSTGNSTSDVMSQKAVTDELAKKATTSEVNAKYTKPSDGIPKSDLASSVQTSLGKADTALQSAPVTSVNGKTGDVTGLATKDEVNAKQNALTETQLAAVNSGITEAKRTKYDGYEEIINQKSNSADLATVATSGSYNDLQNIPTDIAKIGNLSNPNLLINPNFAINQRGQTSYTGTNYTVDRWKNAYGTLKLQSNGEIKHTSGNTWQGVSQYIESPSRLAGKTVTISAMGRVEGATAFRIYLYYQIGDNPRVTVCTAQTTATTNTIISASGTIPADITDSDKLYIMLYNATANTSFYCNWAKLEIGSVATEFSPPSIAEELIKCQRYYQRFIQGVGGYGFPLISVGYASSTTTIVFPIALACSMRNTPTVTYSEIYYRVSGKANNNLISTVNSPVDYAAKGASVAITVAGASGLTLGQSTALQIRAGGYIAFDAEI